VAVACGLRRDLGRRAPNGDELRLD
jgi:hypothetical protein